MTSSAQLLTMNSKEEILERLGKSKFRSRFHLSDKDIEYINDKGMDTIKRHAYDFINTKLIPNNPKDGKQTPMKGHPVFISQHALAFCCRGCIEKWHGIPKDRNLTPEEKDYIVSLIMDYLENEISSRPSSHTTSPFWP